MSQRTVEKCIKRLNGLMSPKVLPTVRKDEYAYLRGLKRDIFLCVGLIGMIFVLIAIYAYKTNTTTAVTPLFAVMSVLYILNRIKLTGLRFPKV